MPLLFGWLLNAVYGALLIAVAPVLLFRRWRYGKYRGGWREKLTGRLLRKHPERQCLWFHAVSVGEVLQLQKILEETSSRFPDGELIITTTTDTGFDVASKKYSNHTVAYFPLDFTWAVARALDSIQPDLVVLVELELWPNFIFECHRRQIPLTLINGRIGEKSFRGYSRIKGLMRRVLNCFRLLAVQNETYSQRLIALGAPSQQTIVTGNIKFDRVESKRGNTKTDELRHAFHIQPHEKVFIAGSTQSTEESYAIEAWRTVQREFPSTRLILVPRHKERFDEVAALVIQQGLSLLRRSHNEVIAATNSNSIPHTPPVLLLDTLGELAACWGLADIAFVGGSLTNRGGQNMIEPAGYGAAVLFGPNTWNFKDVAESLISQDAARVIHGPEELTLTLQELLRNPEIGERLGGHAKEFVSKQQGATIRTVNLISELVVRRGSQEPFERAA